MEGALCDCAAGTVGPSSQQSQRWLSTDHELLFFHIITIGWLSQGPRGEAGKGKGFTVGSQCT